MKVKILGCSGGIGGQSLRTTSICIDDDVLIDAGTGCCDLPLTQLKKIDHVFLTHSHLDHIACLPLMVDSVGRRRREPLIVHATAETLGIIQTHIFNWRIWPDFTQIPDPEYPYLCFSPLELGKPVQLGPSRTITALPANHTVPAVGYRLDSGTASLVFTGDTTTCPELWQTLNRIENLKTLIIECAFPEEEKHLAMRSKHFCPSLLAKELKKLKRNPEIFITHAKPGEFKGIEEVIQSIGGHHHLQMLAHKQVFEF